MKKATSTSLRPSSTCWTKSACKITASCRPMLPMTWRGTPEREEGNSPHDRSMVARARRRSAAPQLRGDPSITPHAQKVGGALGQEVAVRCFAVTLEQAAACRLQLEQKFTLRGMADEAANPADGCQSLPPRHRGDVVEHG